MRGAAAAARTEHGGKSHPPENGRRDDWESGLAALRAMQAEEDADSLHHSYRTDYSAVSGLTMSTAFGGIPISTVGDYETTTAMGASGAVVVANADSFERPLSAPPPPGFGNPETRSRKAAADMMILRMKQDDTDSADNNNNNNHHSNNHHRQHSFSNLAAVLGTGLAQSMEDAALGEEALNYQRQTRHAASRLIGSQGTGGGPALPERGFPTSLSTPPRQQNKTAMAAGDKYPTDKLHDRFGEDARDFMRTGFTSTSASSQQLYHPHSSSSSMPSRDIGTAISEPDVAPSQYKEHIVQSRRMDGEHLPGFSLSGTAQEFKPVTQTVVSSNVSDVSDDNASDITSRQAELELKPYIWDPDQHSPSRCLCILHVSYLRVPDVRSSCETFGIVEGFRADFANRGIYFVSYYDIRSAQYAAQELQPILQRLSILQRSNEDVRVSYCFPLNSSSQFDDAQIVLSEVPVEINEYSLRSILQSFGSIRSIIRQSFGCYAVEFHNVQDAKQAQLEIESSQPFGSNVFVEMAMRSPAVRKKGRELLAMIGRWRQGLARRAGQTANAPVVLTESRTAEINHYSGISSSDPWRQSNLGSSIIPGSTEVVGLGAAYGLSGSAIHLHNQRAEATQLILGPDGRYTSVVVQNQIPFSNFTPVGATPIDPRQQQIIQGPNGQIYLAPVSAPQQPSYPQQVTVQRNNFTGSIVSGGPTQEINRNSQSRTPYYTHVVTDASSLSGRSLRSAYSTGTEGEKDTRHLLLDLDAVESGQDTRTSLMVRNIPNKYTQQMLLKEFEENGHGPGIIDFFYLPIDFKNRCNRGYAFINFVDYRDILPFHLRYFGKHWRTFNSDKICDITYARIQGKAAMLKRFENSALMEKDDEYKPLVFVSNGPDKGQRLPFPDPKNM